MGAGMGVFVLAIGFWIVSGCWSLGRSALSSCICNFL